MPMRLELDGFILDLNITGWQSSDKSNWDVNWCQVALNIKSPFMNYSIDSECLLSCEVEEICETLKQLKAEEDVKDLSFIEPDLEFCFIQFDDQNRNNYGVELIIRFWDDDVLTANSLHLYLDDKDISLMLEYMETIIEKRF